MLGRRNFLGKLLCAVPGIGLLSADSFGKEKPTESSIEKALEIPKGERAFCGRAKITKAELHAQWEEYKELDILAGITWDYSADDVDPITFINGQPVKQYMWEAVAGEHVTPDCRIYKITREEVKSPYIQIHPACITRCNVKRGWIEYARIMRWKTISGIVKQTQKPWSFSYPQAEKNSKERIVLRVGSNFQGLAVNLLDPQGEVITTLRGKI